jgi:hypothetical protein
MPGIVGTGLWNFAASIKASRRSAGVSYTIESNRGRQIAFMSKFPDEDEVRFPPGVKFLVLQNATIGGVRQIIMEEV